MFRPQSRGVVIAIPLIVGVAGCASLDDVYLHDAQLSQAAIAAATAFDNAQPDELWQTMLDNVAASADIEQQILAKSAEQRFEGKLTNLENLSWGDLQRCAEGACWSDYQAEGMPTLESGTLETTQDKLQFLQTQVSELATEIKLLEERIRNPQQVQVSAPLTISATLTENISRAEQSIQEAHEELEALKVDALGTIQARLDALSAPLLNPFPNQRAAVEAVFDEAFENLEDTLADARGLVDLQATLQDDFIAEFDGLFFDAEIVADNDANREILNLAIDLFKDRVEELLDTDKLLEPLNSVVGALAAEIVSTETAINDLQAALDTALGESATPSQTARAVTDLFNKTEHPTLLKLESFEEILQGGLTDSLRERADRLNIGNAFDDIRNREVSGVFTESLENDIGGSICDAKPCQVQDVIDFLKNDESRIEVVRREMLAEFRASELAIYNQQLRSLKEELGVLRELSATLNEQLAQQAVLAIKVEQQISAQDIEVESIVYHGLDCLARSAGETHGESCAADTKTARDQFSETLSILGAYFALNGHIKDQEQQQWVALARQKHLASIEVSRLAARGREQLIANGLQGLVAFTDGGITAEEIAGAFRFLNSSLLTVIAGDL